MPVLRACAALLLAGSANAAGQDASMLVQREISVASQNEGNKIPGLGMGIDDLRTPVRDATEKMRAEMPELGPRDDLERVVKQMQDVEQGRLQRIAKTWEVFEAKVKKANNP